VAALVACQEAFQVAVEQTQAVEAAQTTSPSVVVNNKFGGDRVSLHSHRRFCSPAVSAEDSLEFAGC
jgi:hypothetical protein